MPYLASGCFIAGAIGSLFVAYLLSLAMRYYDNIDVIPMFQSFILLMMLAAGWILLGEAKFYTWQEIGGILSSSFMVCIGIKVLTMKTSAVSLLKDSNECGSNSARGLSSLRYE